MAVYVVGLPVFQMYVLLIGKRQNLLGKPNFMHRYGHLYKRYEPQYYYWEMVVQLRRLTMVCTLFFCRKDGALQAAVGLIFSSFFLAMQFFSRPYRLIYIDRLDSASCVLNMCYIVVGVVQSYSEIKAIKDFFEMSLIVAFALITVTVTALIAFEIVEMTMQRKAVSQASKRFIKVMTQEMIPDPGEALADAEKRVSRILLASRIAFSMLDPEKVCPLLLTLAKSCSLPPLLTSNAHTCNDRYVMKNGVVSTQDLCNQFPVMSSAEGTKRAVTITPQQAELLVNMIGTFEDPDGIVYFVEEDFVTYLVQELICRNFVVPGFSTLEDELRRSNLHQYGVGPTFFSDVLEGLGKYLEGLDRRQLKKLAEKYRTDGTKMSAPRNAAFAAEAVLQELPNTLDPYGSYGFIKRGLDKAEAIELMRLERIMARSLSDSGYLSDYQHNSDANAIRAFVRGCPLIIEWMADPKLSSPQDVRSLHKLLSYASEVHSNNGSFSSLFASMVREEDHAAFAGFLVEATEAERVAIHWMLRRIMMARERGVSTPMSWAIRANDALRGRERHDGGATKRRWNRLNIAFQTESQKKIGTVGDVVQRVVKPSRNRYWTKAQLKSGIGLGWSKRSNTRTAQNGSFRPSSASDSSSVQLSFLDRSMNTSIDDDSVVSHDPTPSSHALEMPRRYAPTRPRGPGANGDVSTAV